MAEDLHNPLNTPGAEPVGPEPTPRRSEEPEIDTELSDFLDEIFDEEPEEPQPAEDSLIDAIEPEPQPEPPLTPVQATPTAPPSPPAQDAAASLDDEVSHTATSTPAGTDTTAPQDDLQKQVLERMLERMNEPEAEPQPAPAMTSDQMMQHYQPLVQQYQEAGWLDEDFVALYPKQAALMVHMWQTGTQLQQGVQQTQQFTQEEQDRRARQDATEKLNTAIDEVVSRGDVYTALSDNDVRKGFQEFLINEVNPRLSQISADFLARQFYAYNHQLILDTAKQAATQEPTPGPSDAALAVQESTAGRGAPTTTEKPEFVDMFVGHAAEHWYD